MTRQFYRPDEVAEILRVSKCTIYRLMENGDMHFTQVGRQRRIAAKDLDSYINENAGDPLDVKSCISS